MLDQHQDIEQSERRRDCHEEVAGDDRLGVIAHKRRPALIATWATGSRLGMYVFPRRARRNPDSELEQVVRGHASNQLAEFQWNGRAARPQLVRQSSRHPARCQRTTVSALTTIKQVRQSHNRDNKARLTRVAASIRRGFTPRSLNSPSWQRSTKFLSFERPAGPGLRARPSRPGRPTIVGTI